MLYDFRTEQWKANGNTTFQFNTWSPKARSPGNSCAASANRVVLKLQSNSELRTTSALSFFSWFTSASPGWVLPRSEEHTSELQSLTNLVCRLLLEKKKRTTTFSKVDETSDRA